MVSTTKEKSTSATVDEELRRMKAQGQRPEPPKRRLSSVALGIIEIAAGVAVIVFSYAAGALISLFLGAVVLLSGILETINGSMQRSTGHIVIGILGAIAGIYILANPLVSLAILSVIVGGYLVVSGAVSAWNARRTASSATGGIIEMVLGLLVLFSGFSISWLVGLYLIIRGIITYNSAQKPARTGA